jgi:hypothetical protein
LELHLPLAEQVVLLSSCNNTVLKVLILSVRKILMYLSMEMNPLKQHPQLADNYWKDNKVMSSIEKEGLADI